MLTSLPSNTSDDLTSTGTITVVSPSEVIQEDTIETQPLHASEPSAEQKQAIAQLQKLRGFKRSRSKSKCLIGMQYERATEQTMKHLTPKRGHAKIDPRTTQIRYVLDQYKDRQPDLELYHTFDFSQAFWNFIYNYFWILSFPLLIYREGITGFKSRFMLNAGEFIGWIPWATCNIMFWLASTQIQNCFIFPFFIMNLLRFAFVCVLGLKYGYLPSQTFDEYNDPDHGITNDYILSLHLMPGWMMQHPLAIGRELYYTEQRLAIDLSKLRMYFRDTKAFDLQEGKHCSCSQYWTTLDWFIPYVFLNLISGESLFLNPKQSAMFYIRQLIFFFAIMYTVIARMFEYSMSEASFADCDASCWIIVVSLSFSMALPTYSAWLWCVCMAYDMTRRWSRMRLCTHLLDPKRETFQGIAMRKSYKAQLFGSVANLKAKVLKPLDLQTIDVYSSETLYSWSQFRTILFDAGKMFFEREEAYNGLYIICSLFILFFFLYSLVTESIVIVWEDFILTMIICVSILGPSMWVLSCGYSLNYQTSKQQKILSERAVEMLHFQYVAEDRNMGCWLEKISKAREMTESIIDLLNMHEYDVMFLGITVDNSVFQLIVSVIGITCYLIGWIIYQKMINV